MTQTATIDRPAREHMTLTNRAPEESIGLHQVSRRMGGHLAPLGVSGCVQLAQSQFRFAARENVESAQYRSRGTMIRLSDDMHKVAFVRTCLKRKSIGVTLIE